MDVQADIHDLHSVIGFICEVGADAAAELGVVEVLLVSRLGESVEGTFFGLELLDWLEGNGQYFEIEEPMLDRNSFVVLF